MSFLLGVAILVVAVQAQRMPMMDPCTSEFVTNGTVTNVMCNDTYTLVSNANRTHTTTITTTNSATQHQTRDRKKFTQVRLFCPLGNR